MLPRRIAGRYAEALFDLAQQEGKTELWERELASLGMVIAQTPDLTAVLTHPEIPLSRKEHIVQRAFEGKVTPEVLALLFMLIKRGHEPDFDVIHDAYLALWNKARRVLPVQVTTAVPLTPQQKQELIRAVSAHTGYTTIQMHAAVDPAIIAGLVVTLGDRVIDVSAQTVLEELRTALVGAPDSR